MRKTRFSIVTMPLYDDIEAIANDRYLCTYNREDKVVVNGKGEIVKYPCPYG